MCWSDTSGEPGIQLDLTLSRNRHAIPLFHTNDKIVATP